MLEDDVDDDAPELSISPGRESAVELRDSEFELRARLRRATRARSRAARRVRSNYAIAKSN